MWTWKKEGHVLYHSNCYDGFGAAYSAWKFLGDENVKYIPVSYGFPLPEMPEADNIYIVDFSYVRDKGAFLSGAVWAREEADKEKSDLLKIIKTLLKIEDISLCNVCMKGNAELIAKFTNDCREVAKEIWNEHD